MDQLHTIPEGIQTLPCSFEGFRVSIEAEKPDLGEGCQEGLGVSAEAYRDIYKEPAAFGLEESEGLSQQNGLVCGLMIACPMSGATGLRRGSSVAGTILQ